MLITLMKIVQISDIHVGSQFQEEVFDKVIDEVNDLGPDAVVVTGDLTNEGLMKEYETYLRDNTHMEDV